MKKKILIIIMCMLSLSSIFCEESADKVLKDVEYKCIPYICDFKCIYDNAQILNYNVF